MASTLHASPSRSRTSSILESLAATAMGSLGKGGGSDCRIDAANTAGVEGTAGSPEKRAAPTSSIATNLVPLRRNSSASHRTHCAAIPRRSVSPSGRPLFPRDALKRSSSSMRLKRLAAESNAAAAKFSLAASSGGFILICSPPVTRLHRPSRAMSANSKRQPTATHSFLRCCSVADHEADTNRQARKHLPNFALKDQDGGASAPPAAYAYGLPLRFGLRDAASPPSSTICLLAASSAISV